MVSYRCYILDAEDHIVLAHDLDCEGDAQAEISAQGLLVGDPYYRSAEVWRATRRVVKVQRNVDQQVRLARRVQHENRPFGSPI